MRNDDRAGREKRGFAPRQGGKNPPRPARRTYAVSYTHLDVYKRQIQEDTMKRLYFTVITPRQPLERKQVATPVTASHGEQTAKRPVRADKKVGRNDPCPCGSGKKYKNCCGADT